jgi:hypothetical protein
MIAFGIGIVAWFRNHLDITTVAAGFILSLLVLLLFERPKTSISKGVSGTSTATAPKITLQSTTLDPRSTDPGITYKAKLSNASPLPHAVFSVPTVRFIRSESRKTGRGCSRLLDSLASLQ